MAGPGHNGSLGLGTTWLGVDLGTLAISTSPAPGTVGSESDRGAFESAVQALEAEIANAGAHLWSDAEVRRAYGRQIREMADDLARQASSGRITWTEAATQARSAREAVMMTLRTQSTPVGLAFAQRLKEEGRSVNELIARKVRQMYGETADFYRLTGPQTNAVYAEIVKSAGRSNPRVNAIMRTLGRAGRSLVVLSIGISVYEVAVADDKAVAAGRELAVTGVGIGGGVAGGALAGLACGPGAPVCVTAGAFIGGALAAFGVDLFW